MDVREKLIGLVKNALRAYGRDLEKVVEPYDFIADFLIHNGITVQEWISVKDRSPERPPDRVDEQGRSWFTPNIDCIVYDGKNVFAANYCFQNKCFWYTNSLEPLNNITHWMPMPQPPKGGNMQ